MSTTTVVKFANDVAAAQKCAETLLGHVIELQKSLCREDVGWRGFSALEIDISATYVNLILENAAKNHIYFYFQWPEEELDGSIDIGCKVGTVAEGVRDFECTVRAMNQIRHLRSLALGVYTFANAPAVPLPKDSFELDTEGQIVRVIDTIADPKGDVKRFHLTHDRYGCELRITGSGRSDKLRTCWDRHWPATKMLHFIEKSAFALEDADRIILEEILSSLGDWSLTIAGSVIGHTYMVRLEAGFARHEDTRIHLRINRLGVKQ